MQDKWSEYTAREKALMLAAAALLGIIAGALFMAPLEAYAASSLPYVTDANERADGAYNATVECAAAKSCELRVTDCKTGKRVKPSCARKRIWLVKLKPHRTYKLQVRERGARKWQTVRYRIG